MRALKYFYSKGDWIWGKYGFYDAFSEASNWTVPRYLAIDQCTIAPMIENLSHRIVVETLHELSRNPGRSAEARLPTNRI